MTNPGTTTCDRTSGRQGAVRYTPKRIRNRALCELDPLDFLARLLMHVPEPRLHLEPVSEEERFHVASSFAEWEEQRLANLEAQKK